MLRRRHDLAIPAALALGLAVGVSPGASAQGPTPASGSGSGTGTGTSAGSFGSTGTGTESSSGLGTTGTGLESSSSTRQSFARPSLSQPNTSRGIGNGQPVLNPGIPGASRGPDSSITDLLSEPIPGGPSDWNSERDKLFAEARSTVDPGERALAMVRIARTAIFSTKFADAETALREASQAALLEPTELIRDQRVIAIVTTMTNLAEELTRPEIVPEVPDGVVLTPASRMSQFTKAARVWQQSGALCNRITNPTYRSQTLYRAVESESYGAQSIANEPAPISLTSPSPGEVPPLGGGGPWPPPEVISLTDELFREAAQNAAMIQRPVWRDRAYVTIAINASAARQYARGLSIARLIPQPEVRTDALVRIAIAQATHNLPDDATSTYGEAAASVASIPLYGPRTILAGVLIDSLISVGRFDDARACVVLYPAESNRLTALEAVALAMGERGAAISARTWIDRDAPSAYRSTLHRRVSDGIIASVERNRSRDLTRGR